MNQKSKITVENQYALGLWAHYLNTTSDWINKEDIITLTGAGVSPEQAVALLVASAGGLAVDEDQQDRILFRDYIQPAVHALAPNPYRQDRFYQLLKGKTGQLENIRWGTGRYAPYECFVFQDLVQTADGKIIPQIGFFQEEFFYPALWENERVWMSITPNEIETMRLPLEQAQGKVLVFGLGLGYFAVKAAWKNTVEQVTVVEKNSQIIQFFTRYILPLVAHKEKIHIVEQDAFYFAETSFPSSQFNYVFTDLWHDVLDGLPLYRRMKSLESLAHPSTRFGYWIEPTLRYYL